MWTFRILDTEDLPATFWLFSHAVYGVFFNMRIMARGFDRDAARRICARENARA